MTRETLAVIREGYRTSSERENALFNMAAAFAATLGLVRGTTVLIRRGRGGGVLRNVVVADRHIHHFVPGIVMAFAAGGTAIALRHDRFDRWLAANRHVSAVGLAWSPCEIDESELAPQPYDIPLTLVVTENGVVG